MGVQMLVSDYLDQVIKSRPYKYSTKQSLIRDIKRLGIADLDTSEVTSALIRDKVDCIPNHNSRRRLYITARSIFKELGVCQDLPKMEGISRIYDLPNHEELHQLIDQSKYRLQKTVHLFYLQALSLLKAGYIIILLVYFSQSFNAPI